MTEQTVTSPKKPEDTELKVVITIKGSRAIVGIQAPDCDPVLSVFEGDLPTVLEQVPALVQEARQQWEANKRYPKADIPTPPPAPVTVTPARFTPQTAVKPQPKKDTQTSLF